MKKLFKFALLFAAALPLMMACSNDNPEPEPGPGPGPLPSDSAPATPESIGFKVVSLGETKLVYSLERGANAVGGLMWIYPTALLTDYVREAKKTNPDVTEIEVIESMLFVSGPALRVDGTETEVELDPALLKLKPDVNYTAILLGILADSGPGDVSRYDFRTAAYPIKGDPQVKVTTDAVTFMGAYFRYTINKDAYGFMRFVTTTEQIDEFLEHYNEEALRDIIIATDGLWDQVNGQSRPNMPNTDADGNATNREGLSWGWDASGLKVTAVAVPVADIHGTTTKKISRLDITLAPVPEGEEAKFTVKGTASATTYTPHFEFEPTTWRCFYRILRANEYEQVIKNFAGGELGYAKDMCDNGGYAIIRSGKQMAEDPIFQNDWIWLDAVSPDTEYVIVATGQNYVGLLNDKLTISEPFRTKSREIGTSPAQIKQTISQVKKKTAYVAYHNSTDDLRTLYSVCIEKENGKFSKYDDAQIYKWLVSGNYVISEKDSGPFGDRWAWVKGMGTDWDETTQSDTYTYTNLTPGTTYVVYYCGEDKDGKVTNLAKSEFTTLPSTVGNNPRIESMKAYQITPMSVVLDVTVNEQVEKGMLVFVQEELLLFDRNDESTLRAALYDFVQDSGIPFEESLRGHEIKEIPPQSANATFYLAVSVTGTPGSEDFRYMKVKLGTGLPPVTDMKMPMLSSFDLKIIPSDNAKARTPKAVREANRKLLERESGVQIPENTFYYRNTEEAQKMLEQLGVYRPLPLVQAGIHGSSMNAVTGSTKK